MATIKKKPFKYYVKPLLVDYKKKTDAIFRAYNKEVKQKKLTTIISTNKLWSKKYKKRLEHIENMHNIKYKTLWERYYK